MMCGRRGEWPSEHSTAQRVASWRAVYAAAVEARWVLRRLRLFPVMCAESAVIWAELLWAFSGSCVRASRVTQTNVSPRCDLYGRTASLRPSAIIAVAIETGGASAAAKARVKGQG